MVGLYDVSLSDMTPDVLYSSVCDKWARTIVLVRDSQGTGNFLSEDFDETVCILSNNTTNISVINN